MREGHVRFDGDYQRASVLRATRGKEMTVLSLAEPALDLSEFDVGGLPAADNNLFVYAGRDLYRPGETLQVSVLPRDADGRALPASPLTATLKRPDGRVDADRAVASGALDAGLRPARHRAARRCPDRDMAARNAGRSGGAQRGCDVDVPCRGISARTA